VTKIIFVLLILLSLNCFSQDFCNNNFALKSNNAITVSDSSQPVLLATFYSDIDRNNDTIRLTFFLDHKRKKITYFIIKQIICDTIIDNNSLALRLSYMIFN